MLRGDQPYETAISPTTAAGLRLAWRARVSAPGATPNIGVTVGFGELMAASNDGFVTALDPATGKLQWRPQISTYLIENAPASTAGTTVVQENLGTVVALDSDTGTIRWRRQVDGALSSPTVVDDDVVGGNGLVWSLSLATGAVKWRRPVGIMRNAAAVVGSRVVVATEDQAAYAFDRVSGRRLWRTALPCGVQLSSPAVAAGRVFLGSSSWRCGATALRLRTGRLLWHTPRPGYADSSMAVDGTRAYVNVHGPRRRRRAGPA